MDDDILGSLTSKKPLSSTTPAISTSAKKKAASQANNKNSTFNIDDLMGDHKDDSLDSILKSQ